MFFIKHILNYLKRYYKIDQGTEFVDALRHLNQPSEVTVPNELIPAGVLMQLRGFYNLHALSINSDWIWPYWMERQSNPHSESFIPRAMSLSYINLTHRNWTGVGVCGGTREGVVDPRGLVTPWLQGWSLDAWLTVDGKHYFPSRMDDNKISQQLRNNLPFVITEVETPPLRMFMETWAFRDDDQDYICHEVHVANPTREPQTARLTFALRPHNPEGLSLIFNLAYNTRGFWLIGSDLAAFFPQRPDRSIASNHATGDTAHFLDTASDAIDNQTQCPSGLANGANSYTIQLGPGQSERRFVVMPIEPLNPRNFSFTRFTPEKLETIKEKALADWRREADRGVTVELPDQRYVDAFEANKAFLVMLNDGYEITAGPLTYHRHWFRDAAFLLNGLGKVGYGEEVAKNLRFTPLKQWKNGYFCSQKGEWDSNGQAIWSIMEHFRLTRDMDLLRELYPAIRRGALWIEKKRHDISFSKRKPRGLLPAGFSAEHLGPNDFYYWDNFWSLRGLMDATEAATALDLTDDQELFKSLEAGYRRDLLEAINRDIEHSPVHALPAAPRRRPDAGMIGNIAAAYPLKIVHPEETPWMRNTLLFIRNHLFHDDGFYQQMIHSGINSYLTLQMAQCMLMMKDIGAYKLINYMLDLATPTWCWPEAIHPRTRGGCMGDGHHGWAAAEWLLLVRNLIIHEQDQVLHITPLLPAEWCHPGKRVAINRAPTAFGVVSVLVEFEENEEFLTIEADWHTPPTEIHWHLPAPGRKLTGSTDGITLEDNLARVQPHVKNVRVEIGLEAAPSIREGEVPGLDELPPPPDA
ncbi:hypothetical protein CVU37_04015 [candidate division BRC1 bacterium HGW-BRC1-1]|jgi:hypothetical protein|nr:MAG: hypothetical protein CVU37_04015 [candidate division BRC1 bacterium HGW-BRC1-1]